MEKKNPDRVNYDITLPDALGEADQSKEEGEGGEGQPEVPMPPVYGPELQIIPRRENLHNVFEKKKEVGNPWPQVPVRKKRPQPAKKDKPDYNKNN